jgi:hypothetical protein
MAISNKDCTLLFYSKTLNVSFAKTLMLGRLKLNASRHLIIESMKKYGGTLDSKGIIIGEFAESLFQILGATQVESLDYSDYEGASLIHDMNLPVPENLHSSFTALVDGGTLEHIFNFPVAIANCMKMLSIGGHYIGISPVNNQAGHGFYQFSPELYFRIFSKANGFIVKKVLVTSTEEGPWYEVTDPALINSRVMIQNSKSLSVIVIAQKVASAEIFKEFPQQSDYQMTWAIVSAINKNEPLKNEGKLKFAYRKYLPGPIKLIIRFAYDILFTRKKKSPDLGTFNSEHFKEIKL